MHPPATALSKAVFNLSWLGATAWGGWGSLARALAGHLCAMAGVAGILAGGWLAGRIVLDWLAPRARTGDDAGRQLLALGMGLGCLSILVLASGLTGVMYAAWTLAGVAIAGVFALRASAPEPLSFLKAWKRSGPFSLQWALVWALLAADALTCLAPEWFYDARVYHLGLPERFLATRKFPVVREHLLTFLPLNTEMLYAMALDLGGEKCARLLNLAFGAMLAGCVAHLAKTISGRAAPAWVGGTAALITVAMPLAMVENETAFADNLRAAWEMLALAAFVRGGRGIAGAGVLTGLAFGAKYLAGVGGAFLGGVLAVRWVFRRASGRELAAFALAVSLVAGPWLVRNWLAGGDPVYPFGRGVFQSLRFSGSEFQRWMEDNRHYGVEDMDLKSWATLPYRAIMDRGEGEFGTFTTGVLPLALAPLLLGSRFWPARAAIPLGILAMEGVVWSLTSHLIRYLLPGLCILCALLARATGEAGRESRRYGRVFLALILIWSACSMILRAHHRYNLQELHGVFSFVTGKLTYEDALAGRGYGETARGLPSGRILLVGEDQVLGLGGRWRATSVFDVPLLEEWARASATDRRFSIKVRQAGLGAVLLNSDGFARRKERGDYDLDEREWGVLNSWWRGLGVVYRRPPWVGHAAVAGSRERPVE